MKQKLGIRMRATVMGALAMGLFFTLTSLGTPVRKERGFLPVTIVEGTSYQVPVGNRLTLRALSATGDQPSDVRLEINGQSVAVLRAFSVVFGSGVGISEIPPGVTAQGGDTVTLAPIFTGSIDRAVVFGGLSATDD